MKKDRPVVLVHLDKNGYPNDYFVTGDATLFIVDERCTDDRVYMWSSKSKPSEIKKVIGKSSIGSQHDKRHAAIAGRVLEALGIKKCRLEVVK